MMTTTIKKKCGGRHFIGSPKQRAEVEANIFDRTFNNERK
jgi:hypothetical protein